MSRGRNVPVATKAAVKAGLRCAPEYLRVAYTADATAIPIIDAEANPPIDALATDAMPANHAMNAEPMASARRRLRSWRLLAMRTVLRANSSYEMVPSPLASNRLNSASAWRRCLPAVSMTARNSGCETSPLRSRSNLWKTRVISRFVACGLTRVSSSMSIPRSLAFL
eukprot:scaffold197757_cov27-Tisochrysis_lutea.AAC.3